MSKGTVSQDSDVSSEMVESTDEHALQALYGTEAMGLHNFSA
jgi:hypothetical protein